MILDNYEEGEFLVPVRRHWWQFWLPRSVVGGRYVSIGAVTTIYAFNKTFHVITEGLK
jgi:hypothetical protein